MPTNRGSGWLLMFDTRWSAIELHEAGDMLLYRDVHEDDT